MPNSSSNATIQFIRGIDERVVPEIRLTRSKDGRTGQAFFIFEQPEALSPEINEDITGMILKDEEGELISRDVRARFVNGSASALEVTYIWKSEIDFERFMRFAQRYAKNNGMGYSQKDNNA